MDSASMAVIAVDTASMAMRAVDTASNELLRHVVNSWCDRLSWEDAAEVEPPSSCRRRALA